MSGPEDEPNWNKTEERYQVNAILFCVTCEKQIVFWHCADLGCPWCAECGANSKKLKDE